jgi:hypothetical protein
MLKDGKWVTTSWDGAQTSFNGQYAWTDGKNTYWSNGTKQYELYGTTWKEKTWEGLTSFDGRYVWTDGSDVFYSNGACKKGNKWYIPLRDVKTPIYKDSLNKYSITDEPLFEVTDITNPYWGNTFTDVIAITVDEVESTLVTYLKNGAMTELFT